MWRKEQKAISTYVNIFRYLVKYLTGNIPEAGILDKITQAIRKQKFTTLLVQEPWQFICDPLPPPRNSLPQLLGKIL